MPHLKKEITIFCFGFGQSARYFIKRLIGQKIKFKLLTTNTSETKRKKIFKNSYLSLKFKGTNYDKRIKKFITRSDYILVSIPPINKIDLVLRNFKKDLIRSQFLNLIYLSSTSVYGDHEGKWVNEKSRLKSKMYLGTGRLKAENEWRKIQKKNNLPINILRLSGIYSKKNNIIKRFKKGFKNVIIKSNHLFSRIRVEDVAQSIQLLFFKKKITGEIFNVSDNKPASSFEIASYVKKKYNLKNINFIEYKNLKNGMLKDFYKESKKVDNKKIKKILKLKLKYPSYKEGLKNLSN